MCNQFTSRNILLALSAAACLLTGAVQDNRDSRQDRRESVVDRREVEREIGDEVDLAERNQNDVVGDREAQAVLQSMSQSTQQSLVEKTRELAAVQRQLQQIQSELARRNGTNQNGNRSHVVEEVRRTNSNIEALRLPDVTWGQQTNDEGTTSYRPNNVSQHFNNVFRSDDGRTHEDLARISAEQEFVRDSHQKMLELTQQLRDAKTDEEKSAAKSTLQEELEAQYDHYLQQHEEPLEKLEARVKKLREDFEGRKKAKSDLVKLRLDTIWYDSQGLGWPGQPQPSNRWAPSTGVGPTAQPSFVGGNIEERFHSRPPIYTPIQPSQPVGPAALNDLPVPVAPQPPVNSRGPVGPQRPRQPVPASNDSNDTNFEYEPLPNADRDPGDQPEDGFQKTIDGAPKIFDEADTPSFR